MAHGTPRPYAATVRSLRIIRSPQGDDLPQTTEMLSSMCLGLSAQASSARFSARFVSRSAVPLGSRLLRINNLNLQPFADDFRVA